MCEKVIIVCLCHVVFWCLFYQMFVSFTKSSQVTGLWTKEVNRK